MDKSAKIYVAGHRGLVGSALMRQLDSQGYTNIVTRTHAELDLTKQNDVERFFSEQKPEYVFLAAAKVGGIYANKTYPAEFIHNNLAIQTNIIHQSYINNVKRLLFLGSSCIYPKNCPQPIKEEYLLTSELEPTNRPYALAKIAGIEMCWSYNRQFGTKYIAVMPANLYGPGDNYDLETSHVLPALIRKFHEGMTQKASSVDVWGDGTPRREFLYSEDMAEACCFVMGLPDSKYESVINSNLPPLLNIGMGSDLTIAELAIKIKGIVGYLGHINYDFDKPNGVQSKLIDSSSVMDLGWSPRTSLDEGIERCLQDYIRSKRL